MFSQHVAVYARRSSDPGDRAVSVSTQERTARRYAADHWPDLPVVAHIDNGLSAANPTVTRPAYEQLIHDIRAGHVAQVVTRDQSRLTRQPSEWEELCTILTVAGITEVHTTTGGTISVSEGSRIAGRIMAVVDAEEAERTKVRIRLAQDALAEEGRPVGRVPYGYRRTLDDTGRTAIEPDPDTSPIVARMVHDVATGASLGMVARTLAAEGIPTPRGAKVWHRETIRSIVTSPTIIGDRVHRGRVIGPAAWSPIVTREHQHAAVAALRTPSVIDVAGRGRVVRRTISPARRYLLTGGLSVCGECGTALIASQQGKRSGGRLPAYACPSPTRPNGGCGRVSILADRFEDHVATVVEGWLTTPATVEALTAYLNADAVDVAPLWAELRQVEERLQQAAERWATGELLDLEHAAVRRSLVARREDLTREIGTHRPAETVTAEMLADAWDAATVEDRRPVVAVLAEPVVVHRAHRDGRRLAVTERVEVRPVWA